MSRVRVNANVITTAEWITNCSRATGESHLPIRNELLAYATSVVRWFSCGRHVTLFHFSLTGTLPGKYYSLSRAEKMEA